MQVPNALFQNFRDAQAFLELEWGFIPMSQNKLKTTKAEVHPEPSLPHTGCSTTCCSSSRCLASRGLRPHKPRKEPN